MIPELKRHLKGVPNFIYRIVWAIFMITWTGLLFRITFQPNRYTFTYTLKKQVHVFFLVIVQKLNIYTYNFFQDILYCRKATKTIDEFRIIISNVPFLFVDVGGQRTHRQKWFSCFDKVMAILFLGMYLLFYNKGIPSFFCLYIDTIIF